MHIVEYVSDINSIYSRIIEIIRNTYNDRKIGDDETLTLINMLKDTAEYKLKDYPQISKREDKMNALLEKYMEKSRMEGKEEGRKEGEEIGRVKEIIRMSRKFNIADNEIQEELLKNRLLEKTQRSERSERCLNTSKNFIKVPERVERISNKLQGDCPVDDSPVVYGPSRGWALAPKLFLLAGTISSTAPSSLLLGAKG